MRTVMFALAVVCAILSGWTSAIAQVQMAGLSPHASHHEAAERETLPKPNGCGHAGKCVHPMLCAACFAVAVTAPGLGRPLAERLTIPPLVDLPLVSTTLQPRSPPPKARLSTG
jgi:hypothetical protein